MQGNAGPECRNDGVTREGKGLEISGVKSRREREMKRGKKSTGPQVICRSPPAYILGLGEINLVPTYICTMSVYYLSLLRSYMIAYAILQCPSKIVFVI